MNILIVNQPLRNRGDESAHRALVRKLLQEIPDMHVRVLFYCEEANAIDEFSILDERVEYISAFGVNERQLKTLYFIRKGIKNTLLPLV